jgi:SAM-dependent methyltransferase
MIRRSFEKGYHEHFLYREIENSPRNQARLALIRSLQPGGQLLEVGCAPGGFLRLAAAHYDIQGIDISRHAIQALREQFGERIQTANIELHPFPPLAFDIIVAFNIFEHLRRPEKVIARLVQALRPGGLRVGSVPYNAHLVGSLVTRVTNLFDRTHVSTLPPDAWQRILAHAGLRELQLFGEIPIGRNRCHYLTGDGWENLAFNLMFVGRKPAG